jgi:hypothetical protein
MKYQEVVDIFNQKKDYLLLGLTPDKSPVAVILGGQPASGKGALINHIERDFPKKNFLVVNGDIYRVYHPNNLFIAKNDIKNYSEHTQIFSNVFTEELIKIAIENKFNIIVEGTMRNPNVPLKTADLFRKNGFEVHAYVIAAYPTITELGIYRRYEEQIQATGIGRLSDINSHNEATKGLLNSVDELYNNQSVNSIHIYSYLAESKVCSIRLIDISWSKKRPPSFYINKERDFKKSNIDFIKEHIYLGNQILKTINPILKEKVIKIIEELLLLINMQSKNKL